MKMPSPMVTATLQAASLSSASNVLAQITNAYQQKISFQFDVYEFLRFVVLSFLTTPPNYKWQQLLERLFPAYTVQGDLKSSLPLSRLDTKEHEDGDVEAASKPKLNIKHTLLKWFIDCMTFGALFNTVAFLAIMGILKNQSWQQIAQHIKSDTFPIIANSYKIWPVASIINFSFVPVEKRIVFLSCVGLIWGIYMSLVAATL